MSYFIKALGTTAGFLIPAVLAFASLVALEVWAEDRERARKIVDESELLKAAKRILAEADGTMGRASENAWAQLQSAVDKIKKEAAR